MKICHVGKRFRERGLSLPLPINIMQENNETTAVENEETGQVIKINIVSKIGWALFALIFVVFLAFMGAKAFRNRDAFALNKRFLRHNEFIKQQTGGSSTYTSNLWFHFFSLTFSSLPTKERASEQTAAARLMETRYPSISFLTRRRRSLALIAFFSARPAASAYRALNPPPPV
jgi:hypothetical protein